MTILALDFSSAQRSVAVARAGVLLASREAAGGRATRAFSLIREVLAAAKVQRDEITRLAVGLGPGSYTGIRASIAVAQGWQLARDLPILGLSSVEALALRARSEQRFGRIQIVVDAQRGEWYLATWEISPAQCREICPLRIVAATEIQDRLQAGEVMVGPEVPVPGLRLFPKAADLAGLALGRTDFIAGEALEPIYLRATNFVKAPPPRNSPVI